MSAVRTPHTSGGNPHDANSTSCPASRQAAARGTMGSRCPCNGTAAKMIRITALYHGPTMTPPSASGRSYSAGSGGHRVEDVTMFGELPYSFGVVEQEGRLGAEQLLVPGQPPRRSRGPDILQTNP